MGWLILKLSAKSGVPRKPMEPPLDLPLIHLTKSAYLVLKAA